MTEKQTFPPEGRRRVVIENVAPLIDGGRHPIKRVVGERVVVDATIFADGHDVVSAVVKYRVAKAAEWSEAPMQPLINDRWRGEFVVTELGRCSYTIEAWVDHFKSWRNGLQKKIQAGQNVSTDMLMGVKLIEEAIPRAAGADAEQLKQWATSLTPERALEESLMELVTRYSDRRFAAICDLPLQIVVDPERACFGAWYEMFPRSFAAKPGQHGTFKDCEKQLPRIAQMGFDVLYFPPIHPIGRANRKGKNNSLLCQEGEPGSPWAIGAAEGGHKSIHPELGTLADFRRLVQSVRAKNMAVALDIAFQCAPDHPYVAEHPDWFRRRADGSIQYAENPPKKYEDIYPFDFECEDWRGLWLELKSIFEHWIEQGVHIFRVDNPHTKCFAFWEWCIGELKRKHPDLIFLAEAFTRPAVMYHLAKLGFNQSYNYFPWRNSKYELTEYMTELTATPVAEFFRPNLWPNTPDILTQYLQDGSRAAFASRLVLAATLGASYGIYGPAFEACESTPMAPGREEYLNAEKFEIRRWELDPSRDLTDLITRVNRIRHENPALRSNHTLRFHFVNNDYLLAYTKSAEDGTGTILTVVNLDPHHVQSGWLDFPARDFLRAGPETYQVDDLLNEARYIWKGTRNYVELNPDRASAHVFRLRQYVRTEGNVDYYM